MDKAKVHALLHPTSIAILGARENPSGWTARIFANLVRFGFPGPVYPVNPARNEVWGVKCFPDLAALPAVPDHLVVMRAAAHVADIIREAAALGTRSATLYAAGFAETGTEEGKRLEAEVRQALDETGLAASGPNCLGNLSARARLLTLPDDRIRDLVSGPVAMVGQSGTTTPGIARALLDRGINVGYVVTSGNETGLVTADYIDYFVTDPDVRLIFCLIEAVRHPQDFLRACRQARDAGKPVVALKMGISEGGRAAALSHTGSLAGRIEAFDAVAGDAGAIRVESADAAVNLIDFLLHGDYPAQESAGVLVYSGGVRGLAVDAAERHGVALPAFAAATRDRIQALLGETQRVSNPIDAAGVVNQPLDVLLEVVAAIRNDPAVGMVLFQEDLPPNEGLNDANRRRSARVLATLEAIDRKFLAKGGKPFALISATSYDLTEFSRDARQRFPHIACLNEPERAFRTIRAVLNYRRRCAEAEPPADANAPGVLETEIEKLRAQANRAHAGQALSEPDAKGLLEAIGIPIPEEGLARSAEEAAALAKRIGYPVVVKGVAAALTHKSDAGAVLLGLEDAAAVARACATIAANVARYDAAIELEGWLVSRLAPAGLELVIGIQRDPEMGPFVMFGTGGIWLELVKDVAFGPPNMSRERAGRLIDATRAGRLLEGYRGAGPFDREAVVDALVAVSSLAFRAGDVIETLDVNPLLALPRGQGALALDALVVIGRA